MNLRRYVIAGQCARRSGNAPSFAPRHFFCRVFCCARVTRFMPIEPRPSTELRLTEQRNERSMHLDQLSARELVELIQDEDRQVPEAVAAEAEPIAHAVELIEDTFRRGGRLIYVGAGTSGRLGVLDASEMPPTYGTDPALVQGIIAGGFEALVRAQEGAEDDPDAGRQRSMNGQ